jgi:hypothetical protein
MYGLKKEIDLSFLIGPEVIQVAIGSFQVQFHFLENISIYVEGEFRYFDGIEEWTWRQDPALASIASRTVGLLGASIEAFNANENGTLILNFSNKHRLTILDSSEMYESYSITRPGQMIVV